MDDSDDTLKLHRDLIIACGWGKEVDVILLLQQGASVRVQDQVSSLRFPFINFWLFYCFTLCP